VSGDRIQVKIEMNTFERSPATPTVTRPFVVESAWFSGSADVPTFAVEELTATKVRALFQRSKGRDLFDLWLAVRECNVEPVQIARCFAPYRPDGWTRAKALNNLAAKLADPGFVTDIGSLVVEMPTGYTPHDAGEVAREVITAIDD
jgi:Nucleotidyl transferase AbiEii toxin, Type IV TA system